MQLAFDVLGRLDQETVEKGQLVGRFWKATLAQNENFLKSVIRQFSGCSIQKLEEILAPYVMRGIYNFIASHPSRNIL